MKVREIMHRGVVTVDAVAPLSEVARFLLDHGITGAPVIDASGTPIGVISMSDLTAHAAGLDRAEDGSFLRDLWHPTPGDDHELHGHQFEGSACARDVMTEFLVRVDVDTSVRELLELMKAAQMHRIFVTEEDRLVGIVTTLDLVTLLGQLLEEREA